MTACDFLLLVIMLTFRYIISKKKENQSPSLHVYANKSPVFFSGFIFRAKPSQETLAKEYSITLIVDSSQELLITNIYLDYLDYVY